MSDILKVLKSLVSDIEAMQSPHKKNSPWFGPFIEHVYDDETGENAVVHWPNLAITLEEAKKIIAEAEKDN